MQRKIPKGRGAVVNPTNRFENIHLIDDSEHLCETDVPTPPRLTTQFLPDESRTIICRNDSPDIPFRFSVNPYRGCEHGCAYCYARPTHETLGMNAGLDFESQILVKYRAVDLFRNELNQPPWEGDLVAFSGVTDCYQPIERKLLLTRGLVEVAAEANQAIGIVTKNVLLMRDVDLLAAMAEKRLVQVYLSVTTLDHSLSRELEPRTASPTAKLRAIRELTENGIPVGVMVAPIIPGLNDHQIPQILEACREAGAQSAQYLLLRLPLAVRPIFLEWLGEFRPLARDKVEAMIRDTRDGQWNDSQFGRRHKGQGSYAEQIGNMFRTFAARCGLDQPLPPVDHSLFRPPRFANGQMHLF
ncbi:MAG: PA0069 family radical SAM protein [Pirellulaceae bacterium]|nr:PA0069 family radical SAM protein [Pirellulaceae bacterium]